MFAALPMDWDCGAVVVDAGTLLVRAGYAGEDCPKALIPAVLCK